MDRGGRSRAQFLNVFIVFFLGGLWHGADKAFIVWGLWIALVLMAVFHADTSVRFIYFQF